jgi:hypothetical protein
MDGREVRSKVMQVQALVRFEPELVLGEHFRVWGDPLPFSTATAMRRLQDEPCRVHILIVVLRVST